MKNDEDEKEYEFHEIEKEAGVYVDYTFKNLAMSEQHGHYLVVIRDRSSFYNHTVFETILDPETKRPSRLKFVDPLSGLRTDTGRRFRRLKNLAAVFSIVMIPEDD